jgi:hypothetical protein
MRDVLDTTVRPRFDGLHSARVSAGESRACRVWIFFGHTPFSDSFKAKVDATQSDVAGSAGEGSGYQGGVKRRPRPGGISNKRGQRRYKSWGFRAQVWVPRADLGRESRPKASSPRLSPPLEALRG